MILALLLTVAHAADIGLAYTRPGDAPAYFLFSELQPGELAPIVLESSDGATIRATVKVATNAAGDTAIDVKVERQWEQGRRQRVRTMELLHQALVVRAGQQGSFLRGVRVPYVETLGEQGTYVGFDELTVELHTGGPR